MDAAGYARLDDVVRLLSKHPETARHASPEGETPLHVSCIRGDVQVVEALIAAGADLDARAHGDKNLKMTPLSWWRVGGLGSPGTGACLGDSARRQ